MLDQAIIDKYKLKLNQPLAGFSWLRTGGAADYFFNPSSLEDLQGFLRAAPQDLPIFVMGVGSNTIFRDGGVEGVVIRLGRAFLGVNIDDGIVTAGAATLDSMVARKAADAGIDLTFLRTIPGAIGGAVAMNAGCYGHYLNDILVDIDLIYRDGRTETLTKDQIQFGYRTANLPAGAIITQARFHGPMGDPAALHAQMESALTKRAQTQPVNDRSCGSTFRNPAGYSSTGAEDDSHDLKAWSVIDRAGLRGAELGGAQMSPMHPNFLVNRHEATAFDLEALGEHVRKTVAEHSGIRLEWEIKRVGRFAAGQEPDWEREQP